FSSVSPYLGHSQRPPRHSAFATQPTQPLRPRASAAEPDEPTQHLSDVDGARRAELLPAFLPEPASASTPETAPYAHHRPLHTLGRLNFFAVYNCASLVASSVLPVLPALYLLHHRPIAVRLGISLSV